VPTIQADLGASSTEMALTASLFILFQGLSGPVWAASGEVFGRRSVYVTSLAVFVTASIGCALAPTVSVLIALRVLQSLGVSAVNTTGAGTLAYVLVPFR
jgi:MFS family permease